MSLFRSVDRDDSQRSASNEPYVPFRRTSASGRIAYGSFACPDCDVPVTLGGPIPLAGSMRCPFCRSIHPIRNFVHVDAFDTSLNTIELRARLPR